MRVPLVRAAADGLFGKLILSHLLIIVLRYHHAIRSLHIAQEAEQEDIGLLAMDHTRYRGPSFRRSSRALRMKDGVARLRIRKHDLLYAELDILRSDLHTVVELDSLSEGRMSR